MPKTRGVIFAASGERYTQLARRTARNLRGILPDMPIDLFTDQTIVDPVFAQITPLSRTYHRPKIEALQRTRFDKTLYLDCDVVAVADPSDVFDLLDRFDIVGAHENFRNGPLALKQPGAPMPAAFPQINSGVLGLAKSDTTQTLLTRWQRIMDDNNRVVDQPVLRRLLFETDIRFYALPVDYNLMHEQALYLASPQMTAPRLLHLPALNTTSTGPSDTPIDLRDHLSALALLRLEQLIATDRTLGGTADPKKVWRTRRQTALALTKTAARYIARKLSGAKR